MDEVQRSEIGERIRQLREESPETNRSIADYCGVGERTVAGWIAGMGISYKNAVKVAELFESDIDWLWRGREQEPTPDLMGTLSPGRDSDRLDRIEKTLQALVETTTQLVAAVGELQPKPAQRKSRKAQNAGG